MNAPSRARVLVVDDDRAVGMVLTALITQAGHQARYVGSGPEALAALASGGVDVIVSDVRMPGMDGMELLAEVQRKHRDVPVILLTAHGTVSLAVEAMKAGATDFLTKPFDRDEVLFTIGKALTGATVAADKPPEPAPSKDGPVVGTSPAMLDAMSRLGKAAPTMATVLLRGESGHRQGGRGTRDPSPLHRAARGPSSRCTAARCPTTSSSPSSSATRRARSRAR
jgi:two-component system response regulator AtoC